MASGKRRKFATLSGGYERDILRFSTVRMPVIFIRGWEIFCSRQLPCQLGWFMDQDGQVLRADPGLAAPVFQAQQGDFIRIVLAVQAYS